ncbi:hypothetical protein SB861_37885 [Paraburkholderia sp. SIMBA_049]
MKQLKAPNGKRIIGTLEHVPGCAVVNGWNLVDGKLEPEYAGGSDMYWDDSKTQRGADGEMVVLDEDGNEHSVADCNWDDE